MGTPEGREQAARAEDPAQTFARTLRFIATRDPSDQKMGETDRFLAANALELHPEFWEDDDEEGDRIDERAVPHHRR